MIRMPKLIRQELSVRISLMVVIAMALLLMASLMVMLHYSRKAVKEEALEKASQSLDGIVERIDNVLLSVEQTTGNIYFSMMPYLDDPEMMFVFSRKLIESNPCVAGCAIAFKEDFYKDRKQFMAYIHRADSAGVAYADSHLVRDDMFGNTPYTEQVWFTKPMESAKPYWLNPLEGMESADEAPVFTFSLPIPGVDRKPLGVIGVDVSLSLLSTIVSSAKPSPNSYCTLLDKDGQFIVHPNADKLMNGTALNMSGDDSDENAREAVQAMVSGESGYKPFRLNGMDYYVFYKPFVRSEVSGRYLDNPGWSVGIIYPESDIFGDYNSLFYYVLAITIVGLLLMFLLCHTIIHRQLNPLLMLTEKAQHIANGNYDEPIPDSRQEDEIGRLQDNFQHMQKSLANHIGELERLTATLKERGDGLRAAYTHAQKADRMKTAFLHNMTNQMLDPAEAIDADVNALSDFSQKTDQRDTAQLVSDIQQKGNFIAELLNNLINMSDEELKKGGQA